MASSKPAGGPAIGTWRACASARTRSALNWPSTAMLGTARTSSCVYRPSSPTATSSLFFPSCGLGVPVNRAGVPHERIVADDPAAHIGAQYQMDDGGGAVV